MLTKRSRWIWCTVPKSNNFDLIRLAAALQVAVAHSMTYLRPGSSAELRELIGLFPGVPIFFFISGFLISRSFERNPLPREYALNRVLRIYPGLIACFVVSVATVAACGYFAERPVPLWEFLRWVIAQLSFVQFHNPQFMRDYGVGVLNGSLWTITVELQFYVLVPVVYAVLRRVPQRHMNLSLLVLALIFLGVNRYYASAAPHGSGVLWFRLLGVSFAPWFYMFLLGVLFQRNHDRLARWLGGRFFPIFFSYCVLAFSASRVLGLSLGNLIHPLLFVALAALVFSAAFTRGTLSDRLLRRNDVSYGVYIYHMPVANFLLATGLAGIVGSPLIAISATLLLAFLSWRLIEKPALALKRHALYRHDKLGD